MSGKYTFVLSSGDSRKQLPPRIIIGQQENETIAQVALKLLGYLIFARDRLEMEVNLHNDAIPFKPDLVQLDYEMRPVLWVECGDCNVNKLNKLAVKVPEAEIWVLKGSEAAVLDLMKAMGKDDLRRDRYHLIGFDAEGFEELCGQIKNRNEVLWVRGDIDETSILEFDFNGLWFELGLKHYQF